MMNASSDGVPSIATVPRVSKFERGQIDLSNDTFPDSLDTFLYVL